MDSGAFTEVTTYGGYRHSPANYAASVRRWALSKTLRAAVAQDYMCEPFVLKRTGMTVLEHQLLTVQRYDAILTCLGPRPTVPIMPVLQGYEITEYIDHLRRYAGRLGFGMWVGVGSVCKRNANPEDVYRILEPIKSSRPDLRLHGFGLKLTALAHAGVRSCLYSSDSMAWSMAARRGGRDANSLDEARAYWDRVQCLWEV
jgi:hypothetical protein